jgi:hypothetical protein
MLTFLKISCKKAQTLQQHVKKGQSLNVKQLLIFSHPHRQGFSKVGGGWRVGARNHFIGCLVFLLQNFETVETVRFYFVFKSNLWLFSV